MNIRKYLTLFLFGGSGYILIEMLWRGWSHITMFFAGGTCFLLLGGLEKVKPRLPWLLRALTGAGVITMVEFLFGLLFNRSYAVWDYRNMPGNLYGQICVPFFLLWIPISLGGMKLYRLTEKLLALSGRGQRKVAG